MNTRLLFLLFLGVTAVSRAQNTTDTVQTYGLTSEPALFIAIPDGTIAGRLDYVFDATELDEALSAVVQ